MCVCVHQHIERVTLALLLSGSTNFVVLVACSASDYAADCCTVCGKFGGLCRLPVKLLMLSLHATTQSSALMHHIVIVAQFTLVINLLFCQAMRSAPFGGEGLMLLLVRHTYIYIAWICVFLRQALLLCVALWILCIILFVLVLILIFVWPSSVVASASYR